MRQYEELPDDDSDDDKQSIFSFNPTPSVTSEGEGVHRLARKATEKKEEAITLAYQNKHLFEAKGGDLPADVGSFTLHDE